MNDSKPVVRSEQIRQDLAICYVYVRFYPRDAMLARVFAIVTCLSVRPSVCHTPVLCQNEES